MKRGATRQFDETYTDRALALKAVGKTALEAATELGCNVGTIYRYVGKGWKRKVPSNGAFENRGIALAMREDGYTLQAIAERLGLSRERVRQYLAEDAPELTKIKATKGRVAHVPRTYLVGEVIGKGCSIIGRSSKRVTLKCHCGKTFSKVPAALTAGWSGECAKCRHVGMRKCDYDAVVRDYRNGISYTRTAEKHGVTKLVVHRAVLMAGALGDRKSGLTWSDMGRRGDYVNKPEVA